MARAAEIAVEAAFREFGESGEGIGNAESDRIAFMAGGRAVLEWLADDVDGAMPLYAEWLRDAAEAWTA